MVGRHFIFRVLHLINPLFASSWYFLVRVLNSVKNLLPVEVRTSETNVLTISLSAHVEAISLVGSSHRCF